MTATLPLVTAKIVLIADDSATVRALARMELESAGYRVLEAADGEQALAAALATPPDVVLLDIEMPVLDGYATVVALKADPRTADVPVVFLTGRSGSDDVVEALRLCGHDYLRKPPKAPSSEPAWPPRCGSRRCRTSCAHAPTSSTG